jgi:spoIIIJ-associated protein
MDVVETSAKTVDEAIEKALKEMGSTREEVNVTVISEGKSGGLFGFGAEEAQVRVERISGAEPAVPADISGTATETLKTLLTLLGVDGTVEPASYPDESDEQSTAPVAFNVVGDDLGLLIGRRGQTLAALQYMLRLIVGHQTKTWVPIVVDAEGYKARRQDALKALALRMADHVKTRGSPFTLEPMPAYERRIVHITLADNPSVFTESIGEGESRKVVIQPKFPSSTPRSGLQGPPDHTGSMRGGFGGRKNYPQGGQRGGGYQPRRPQPY